MATSASGAAKADDGVKFTITVQCNMGGEKRAVSYTVFKRTLMSQVFDSSVQFFKLDPAQVILVVKNKVALTHKCVEDYRLADKSVLDLIHLKEAPTIELTLKDQAGNSMAITASTYHPLSDVVKAFCKHLGEETGFSDLYHGGIALDLDASPASIGLKTGEQLFCYCYKAACKQHWISVGKPEQAKSLRFIKFYFSDWKYGYKTFPIFRHDVSTPMEVLIKTFCAWRGLDYEQTGFLYSYTYKQVQQGDTATNKALADGDTILAYSRQELQGRLWDAILAGSCSQVLDLLDQGAELSTSIGPEEWGKHPLHAAVANGHVELVRLLLQGGAGMDSEQQQQLHQHQNSDAARSRQQLHGGGKEAAVAAGAGSCDISYREPKPGFGPADDAANEGADASADDSGGEAEGEGEAAAGPVCCGGTSYGGSGAGRSGGSNGGWGGGGCSSHRISLAGVCGSCDPNQLDYASDPPLWHAVENNLVGLVELLLAAGATAADIPQKEGSLKDQAGTGYSACPHAARKGHAETLRVLLAAGANPWMPDADGYTAYDYALDHAKPPALVAALLEGDLRFEEMQQGFQAAYQRMCQMLKRTQRYPALGCPCRTCNSLLEIRAPETEASRLVREQIGCVALVRAVQAGGPHCIEVMELLLKHGALLDGQDYDGRTALHQAIRYNRLAEAAWLTSKGAHLDIPDFEGLLPLHQAGCSGFFDITRLLVNAGAPLNLHTIKYVSQEQLDAQAKKQAEGPLGSKKAKRKQQLDVSGLTTIGGNSPLALAIRHGHGAIVEYLLSQNAVFDLKNAADSSAFHAALDKGSAAIAGLLLQHINKKAVMSGVSGASGSGGTSSRSPTAVKGGGSSAREREKEGRLSKREAKREAVAASRASGDKEKGEGRDTVVSGSEGGAGEGAGASGAGAGASAAPVEPPVAFDAGAGLREMVLRERERLRQQLGLSTTSSSGNAANGGGSGSAGTSGVTAEPKSVLSIFARNSGSSSAGAALRSAAAATAAPPLPPDTPGAAPLSSVSVSATTRSSSNGSGEAGGICSGVNTGGAVVSCNSNALEEKRSGGSSVGNGSTATCDSSMSEPPSSGSAGESSISSTASTKVPYGEEAPIAQQTCSEQQQERQQRRQQQKHEAEEEEEEVDRTAATAGSGRVRTCGDKPATAATSTCSEVVSTDDSPGDTGQQLEQAMAGTALGGEAGSGETSATPVSAALLPSAVMPPPPPPSQQQQELSGSRKPVPQKEVEPFPQPQPSQPPQQMAGASSAKTLEILEAPAAASAQAAHGPTVSIVSTSVSPPDPGSGKDASKSVASGQLQVRPPTVVSAQPMAPSKQGSAARPVLTACGTENLNKTKNGMDPGTAVTAAPSAAASVLPMVSPIKVKFRAKPVEAPPASPGLAATAVAAPQSTNMIATKAMATAAQPPPPPPPPPSAMVSIPSEPAIITCTKIRRGGRVITVPAAMTSNRNRGADQQQPTASKHNHMGGAESSGPAYLTIPASLLSARPQAGSSVAAAMMGPSSSLNPGGVASATGGATLSSSGAVPAATVGSLAGRNTSAPAAVAVVTGVSSGLRPAALSYSPGGISGQLYFQAQTPQQQQQQQQPPASPALSIAPASMPAAAAMLAGSLMPPPCSSSTAPAEATLPAGASLPPPSTGPLPCFPQPPHAHMQGPAASLSILPQPHLQPLAMPAVPPPPPGFAPRPMSDKPPLAAATALPPPPPTQALTPLVHTSAAIPAGTGGLSPPMSSAADVAMPEMENLVLSVVDQGLEESVGVGALGGRLMLGGGEVGSDNASGLVAGGGGIQAAGGGVAAVADGRWPHPHDHTTAAMLPTGGLPTDRRGAITGTSGSVLVDTQPVGLHRNIRHAPAVPMGPQPAGTIHAATAAAGSGGGSVTAGGGAVTSGPFLGTSIAAAMSRAHSDELGTLGGLLERSSSLAAPAVAGGGDAALAATGAVLDRTNDQAGGTSATASGGIASRTASQHTLSRYDSGGILGQPSHGTSVALFSADVWAADGGAMAGAAAAGGMDGGGGSERRSAHGDSWVAMAEAQQLQLSQAMEALANGPVGAPAATVVATASGSFVPPGSSGLLAFAGASLMPLPAVPVTASAVSATAAVTDASGSRTDAAATPATEMAPLPELPAFLFDEVDEHKYQRLFQNHEAGDGRESAGDASCITSAAGSGGSGAAAGMGPWVNGSTLMAGPVGRPGSGGVVAGVDGHPPPPPPGGTRPMMFGAAGPGAVTSIGPGVNASIGMGQMGVPPQVPYGHGPGVLYTPAMGSHAAAAFGGGHPGYPNAGPGPYCDWYGTAAAATYGGFRQPMMVSPSGGMFGTAAQAAAMPGGRVGGLMPQASHAPQAPTAQGSFTSSSQPHTHSHPLTIQQSQQGAAPAAAQASAWFTGGGGKAAALSGMTARIGGGGGSSGNAASSGAAGPAEAASAGPISGGGTGGGGGNGNSSGSGVRHSHSRSGKGRR